MSNRYMNLGQTYTLPYVRIVWVGWYCPRCLRQVCPSQKLEVVDFLLPFFIGSYESQNGLSPLPLAGTPYTRQCHSKPHSTWPWILASITSLVNLLQCLTSLTVKHFFLRSNQHILSFSLNPLLFFLSQHTLVKSPPSATFRYWKENVRSPQSIFFTRLNKLSSLYLS